MRKLAWFAVFFAAAALLILLLPAGTKTWFWALPLICCAVFGLTFLLPGKEKPLIGILRMALLGFGIGCLYVLIWNQVTQRELKPLLNSEQTVEAVVLEDSSDTDYGIKTDIRIGHLRCTLYSNGATTFEAGQRLRARAAFKGSQEKTNSDYYLSLGVPLFGYAKEEPEILGKANAYWRFVPARIGAFLRERISEIYDPGSAAFLLAVLTGDRSRLKQDIWFSSMLRSSGVAHCVAVSGMHLSFLVMFLNLLLGRGRLSALVCIPVTLLFMAMTGFSASVVRAGVMQIAVCGAQISRKQYDSLTALGLALIVLLILNPYCIRNAGMILSFSSTLGILLFYPKIKDGLPKHPAKWGSHSVWARLWNGAQTSLGVSLASAVFTTPFNALFFRQISLLAPVTNLLVMWAVSLCFCLGLLGVIISLTSLSIGMIFRFPVGLLVGYIRKVTGWIGTIPVSSLYIRSPYLPCWLTITWICMGACHFLPDLEHRTRKFTITALFGLALFLGLSWLEFTSDTFSFCALDVGQGQCLIMTGPQSTTMIDCGGSLYTNAGDLAAEYLFAHGRFGVDNLILTHFHLDHVNGVPELLRRLKVDKIYCPHPDIDDTDAGKLISCAEDCGVTVVYLEENVLWIKEKNMEMAIIPPLNQIKENESGLCISANAGRISFLCTGDAGAGTERRLLERMQIENPSVLVAGHHGSANSVSEDFLEAVKPGAVIISVGRNSYGLPSQKTLDRIQAQGITIYRTDEQGDILLVDNQGWRIWGN